jgi:hypothetical protein
VPGNWNLASIYKGVYPPLVIAELMNLPLENNRAVIKKAALLVLAYAIVFRYERGQLLDENKLGKPMNSA